MRPDNRLIRGILVTIASLFLIGGVALAANGTDSATRATDPALISPRSTTTEEPTRTPGPPMQGTDTVARPATTVVATDDGPTGRGCGKDALRDGSGLAGASWPWADPACPGPGARPMPGDRRSPATRYRYPNGALRSM